MLYLLGLVIILAPIFIIVSLWIELKERLRVKILNTCLLVLMLLCVFALGDRQNELDEVNTTIGYIGDRDNSYLDCVDKNLNVSVEKFLDNCVVPNINTLRNTYNR